MSTNREIIILPTLGCRRGRSLLKYLRDHDIPFTEVELVSPQGARLIERHGLRASPGILVDGASVSPFDLLIPPVCQVDQDVARRVFGTVSGHQTRMEADD